MKKTDQTFKNEVYTLVGNEYTFLESYINNDTKIKVIHNKCKYTYKVAPHYFLNGRRCPNCAKIFRQNKKILSGKNTFEKLILGKYSIIEDYKNSRTKVTLKCNKCNFIFSIKPNDLQQGHGCPKCAKNLKCDEIEFRNYINNNAQDYEIVGDYINNKTKISLLHKTCNNIYQVQPVYFKLNRRCPYCKRSKGEEAISKWLNDNNYEYEQYFTFDDLYYKSKSHPLSFDFKITTNLGKIILIEYDGEFHEQSFKDYNTLENQQIRDNLKNEYCKKHNIQLYRINYRDYEIINEIMYEIIKKSEN